MFQFDVEKWVPKFLLADKNGYALAKAIETGLQKMNDIIAQGVDCIGNYDTMPEWRLDELAWETNCLYDYNADIETKRRWIRDALPMYRVYGTPQAIIQYVGNYFDNIDLEENWLYGGEPYHFRITVEGDWTPENEAWTQKAVETAKNVRSVLDSVRIGCKCYIGIEAEGEVLARFRYPMTGSKQKTGTWPQDAYQGVIDESAELGVDAQIMSQDFSYQLTGTKPETNTFGITDEWSMGVTAELSDYLFGYQMAGEKLRSGTKPWPSMVGVVDEFESGFFTESFVERFTYLATGRLPQENTTGVVDDTSRMGLNCEIQENSFKYPVTGEKTKTGTVQQINTVAIVDEKSGQGSEADDAVYKIVYKMCGESTF